MSDMKWAQMLLSMAEAYDLPVSTARAWKRIKAAEVE